MQKVTPPAPAGVPVNNSSPMEEFTVTVLLCMFTFRSKQYGNCVLVGIAGLVWQEPGSGRLRSH